jgi:hypothetical protein
MNKLIIAASFFAVGLTCCSQLTKKSQQNFEEAHLALNYATKKLRQTTYPLSTNFEFEALVYSPDDNSYAASFRRVPSKFPDDGPVIIIPQNLLKNSEKTGDGNGAQRAANQKNKRNGKVRDEWH